MKALRRHLAEAFPETRFTIENRGLLIVEWSNGPTREAVKGIVMQHDTDAIASYVVQIEEPCEQRGASE